MFNCKLINIKSTFNAMLEIEEILKKKKLCYSKVSNSMYKFSLQMQPDIIVGYISITHENKILCRLYYKTVELSYVKSFIYDDAKFDDELSKIPSNFIKLYNKKINDVLDSI